MFASARIMRNKQFLLWMTKPFIRARDAKRGLNIIADDLQKNAVREGRTLSRSQARSQARNEFGIGIKGELGLASMTIREALAREARFLGVSMPLASGIDSEARESVSEAVGQARDMASPFINQAVTEIPTAAPPLQNQANEARQVLRQQEINKLLGIQPTQ